MENPHQKTVRRAALPEILFLPDLALALEVPQHEAEQAARAGLLGPTLVLSGRLAILRRDLLEHLSDQAKSDPKEPRDIYTVARAAREFDLSESAVRDHCRAGRIPARRIGRRWLISRPALLSYLAESEPKEPRRRPGSPSTQALRILAGKEALPKEVRP